MNATPQPSDDGKPPLSAVALGTFVASAAQPKASAAPETANPSFSHLSAKYLDERVEDAELLLGYAADVGLVLEDKVGEGVFKARIASAAGGFTEETAAALLTSLTTLAARVKPVTAESLRAYASPQEARASIRLFGRIAMGVGLIIVFISWVTFVSTGVAERIKTDITTANGLVAKLSAELGPWPPGNQAPATAKEGTNTPARLSQNEVWFGTGEPPHGLTAGDIISDLEQFSATTRDIYSYAKQLKYSVLYFGPVPYEVVKTNANPAEGTGTNANLAMKRFTLTPGLGVPLALELKDRVDEYQTVRGFASSLQARVTVIYGAIATCILPVLYALLGAGAYLLRSYEDQIRNRTFTAGDRHIARFLIAGIGGLVVGLFNVSQGVTISPFAMAFLVGYAVDVFFTFLEGLLQMFKRNPAATAPQPAPPVR